jgi:hypothetical protein
MMDGKSSRELFRGNIGPFPRGYVRPPSYGSPAGMVATAIGEPGSKLEPSIAI